MKKAQGISINVVIIAVIALIVLVVLAVIFTGRLSMFSKGISSCTDKNGVCMSYNKEFTSAGATCKAISDDRTISLPGTDCESESGSDSVTCCI